MLLITKLKTFGNANCTHPGL